MAKYTDAQNKATQRYIKKAYDNYMIRFPKGYKAEVLEPAADRAGESVNGYIRKAVEKRIAEEEEK